MSNTNKINKLYPHVHKGRFYNYKGEKKQSMLIPSMRMLIEWFLNSHDASNCNLQQWFEPFEPQERSESLQITWVGHSTFLIQVGGFNILTDPIFGNLSTFFKRILPPGIPLEKLPPIDFVIISHNHLDHMDTNTLMALKSHKNITFLVPQGDKLWFINRNFERVIESMWWNNHKFDSDSIEFTFLPAFHWAQRGLFDYNRSLWGSWMINCNGIKIYFAGDTAYSSHFKQIGQEFGYIDVALMPIGPCEPKDWMSYTHVDAEEAGQAFLELNASHFIPMHWGTYHFGIDEFDLPYKRIVNWWNGQSETANKFLHTLKIGKRFALDVTHIGLPSYQQKQLSI